MRNRTRESRRQMSGLLALAVLLALLAGNGNVWGVEFSLTEIGSDPATLARTYRLDVPTSGIEGSYITIELSGELTEDVLLDARGPYLFGTAAAGLVEELDAGIIPDALKTAFSQNAGIELSADDALIVVAEGRAWRIFPATAEHGEYVLVRNGDVLHA